MHFTHLGDTYYALELLEGLSNTSVRLLINGSAASRESTLTYEPEDSRYTNIVRPAKDSVGNSQRNH